MTYPIEEWGGRIEFVNMGDASSLLRDGHLNAVTVIAGYPYAPFEEMNTARQLSFIDLSEEVMNNFADKYGYFEMEVPSNSYTGQSKEVKTVGGGVIIIARESVPDEVVYEVTKWMNSEGLPGAMYTTGVASAWIAIGLTIGAYLNFLILAPRLRVYTEVANDSITIPDFFENRFEDRSKTLRFVSAVVIIIFFTLYTSAGLVSGGTLFESAFGLDYKLGLLVTTGVVVSYTLLGGFLAVSLTDFVQGIIIFLALVLVPLVAFSDLGGIGPTFDEIRNINPTLLDLFNGTTVIGTISLLAWGLGYFGQPHIIVRFMAISSVKELKPARRIAMVWMIFSIIGATLVGLIGIAFVSQTNATLANPETIFIKFAEVLFHPFVGGFLLSAILAAIMSTISSQLLVTSSALTEDFYKSFFRRTASDKELVTIGRISVLAVALISAFLAYSPNNTILSLVGYAWAGFGAAFGPAILLSLFWKQMTKWGALAGITTGAATVLIWVNIPMLKNFMYEMVPGFSLSLLAVIIVSLITNKPSESVQKTFEQMKEKLSEETGEVKAKTNRSRNVS